MDFDSFGGNDLSLDDLKQHLDIVEQIKPVSRKRRKTLSHSKSQLTHHVVHAKPVNNPSILPFLKLFQTFNLKREQAEIPLAHLAVKVYGKRVFQKQAVQGQDLTEHEQTLWYNIQQKFKKNPLQKNRVIQFINHKSISRRVISYFVVHYSYEEKSLWYWLDRRSYPHTIIGEFNDPNNETALQLKSQGHDIRWVNFHQLYKVSKSKIGKGNYHDCYDRTAPVDIDGKPYAIGVLNFYMWLDEVGGFDIFYKLEDDIRAKKAKYDEQSRTIKASQAEARQRRKHKVVMKHSQDGNFKAFALSYNHTVSNCGFSQQEMSLEDFGCPDVKTIKNQIIC